MTPRQVYLEAARMLAEEESNFSCFAIREVEGGRYFSPHPFTEKYQEVFFPQGDSLDFCDAVELFGGVKTPKARNLRVLMTTLMAVSWRDFE